MKPIKVGVICQMLSFILTIVTTAYSCNGENMTFTEIDEKPQPITDVYTGIYFVDSENGSDKNSGYTKDTAWKSLSKVSSSKFKPGDQIKFKKGQRFNGHLVFSNSGTANNPIVITSYGEGSKPIITGEVGSAEGGDFQEAILVENNDNFVFEDLEVQNERIFSREGVDDLDAYGIYILNSGTRIMKNFIFRNLTFRNVYAPKPILKSEGESAFNGLEVAAVRLFSTQNRVSGQEKRIDNVLVEDCYFTDLQRLGVHIKHGGGKLDIGTDETNRNTNMVFRNNEFHNTGGTCILPIRTYNCLIENNIFDKPGDDSDPRMPNRGSAVWTWGCVNTVIQNNQCLHIRGYLDSHGVHIDHNNVNTFIQYNYMEDCEGGFVEILGGNVNAVYRFNVSVNDGWRNNPNWKNSNHTLWINEVVPSGKHVSDQSYIYNNTIFMDKNYATAIDMDGKNTHIYNNIFYAVNGANIGGKQVVVKNNDTPLQMQNNLFFGTINTKFINMDSNAVNGNPLFSGKNAGTKFGYQLKSGSPAINAGIAKPGPQIQGAGTGVFKDLSAYPTEDFYGNPIDLFSGTPNIGACNAKHGEAKTN
ncbi:right-handed parallel beta-helix repeat-containing protein [Algibacter mikhailovii]|uniref:Right handed beta helix domain-containing protein n=1 Tax=Algibacter mikhailovii TaxID=425498 RepID=A0A918VBJ3_9FLAO|nr:right-handed parallel beta-helix repeat-containing protein [Algibacter mikhailovii]GGZ87292.1 hypothetical protein GCM10007028_26820 [Algibacter mikhailovii]